MPTREQIPVGELKPSTFVHVHPLGEFYLEMGLALPPLQQVDGEAVPRPYKQLLVHHDDMTPTLENYYGRDIHLRLLSRRCKGTSYFREVVLLLDGTDQPVEFGAIKICLDRLGAEARRQILEEQRPLGHILHECGVKHSSRPKAFLRLAPDPSGGGERRPGTAPHATHPSTTGRAPRSSPPGRGQGWVSETP